MNDIGLVSILIDFSLFFGQELGFLFDFPIMAIVHGVISIHLCLSLSYSLSTFPIYSIHQVMPYVTPEQRMKVLVHSLLLHILPTIHIGSSGADFCQYAHASIT